jgi:hypothetical protein
MPCLKEQLPVKGGLTRTTSTDPKHPAVAYSGEAQVRLSQGFVHNQRRKPVLTLVPSITFVGLEPGVYEVSVSADIATSRINQVYIEHKKLLYGVHGVGADTRYSAFDNPLTDAFTATSTQELITVHVSAHLLGRPSPSPHLLEASDALFFTSLVLARPEG